MPLNIRDNQTTELVRRLAARRGHGLTEAVRTAVENELRRMDSAPARSARLMALRAQVLQRPVTGLPADKAFFDDLSGES